MIFILEELVKFLKKNFSYQYLLVNHTRTSSLKLNNINKNKNKKWLIDDFLCISTELLLIYKQFKSIFWILKNKKFLKIKCHLKILFFHYLIMRQNLLSEVI